MSVFNNRIQRSQYEALYVKKISFEIIKCANITNAYHLVLDWVHKLLTNQIAVADLVQSRRVASSCKSDFYFIKLFTDRLRKEGHPVGDMVSYLVIDIKTEKRNSNLGERLILPESFDSKIHTLDYRFYIRHLAYKIDRLCRHQFSDFPKEPCFRASNRHQPIYINEPGIFIAKYYETFHSIDALLPKSNLNTIVLFNVSGTPIKISTAKLFLHPQSLLTTMVKSSISPQDGFLVECNSKIFAYILRFILYGMQINLRFVADKLHLSERQVREVIDRFKFNDIYVRNDLTHDIWQITRSGDLEQLKACLRSGIHPDLKHQSSGCTPLMYAVQHRQLACVKELIDAGADLNVRNNKGENALFYVRDTTMVDFLCRMGIDVNLKDNDGASPLLYFSQYWDENIIHTLIKQGAYINIQDADGNTPLHIASMYGKMEIIKLLLRHGADTKLKNRLGEIPLASASRFGRSMVVQELVKYI